ncbi:MAG: aromatic-ring-hydroxylating dioxygenase subunit beta [Gammaproteobacteria bacterium]
MSKTGQVDVTELEQFLFYEARLLDEQRWEEWEQLYGEDGEYWVPASYQQPDPHNHVSLIYETGLLRAVRIKRFRHPNAFSLQLKPRSTHFISNIMFDGVEEGSGALLVHSKFIMLQLRRDTQDVFGGTYTHKLKQTDSGYQILHKRVDLLNCDAPLENILLYL